MDILKQLALVSLLTAFGCTSASSPDGGSGTATNETSSSASSGSSSGSTGSSSLSSSGTGTTRTSSATSASGGSGGSGISGTTTSSGACPTTGVSSSSTGGGGIPSTSYGSCTKDLDCPGCGWVCSWSLGHICVPANTKGTRVGAQPTAIALAQARRVSETGARPHRVLRVRATPIVLRGRSATSWLSRARHNPREHHATRTCLAPVVVDFIAKMVPAYQRRRPFRNASPT